MTYNKYLVETTSRQKYLSPSMPSLEILEILADGTETSNSGNDILSELFLKTLWVNRYFESNVYLPAGISACKRKVDSCEQLYKLAGEILKVMEAGACNLIRDTSS